MIGQDGLESLWDHIGKVQDGDTFEEALTELEEGINAHTNQAVCHHKLFTKLPQGDKQFSIWYLTVREQAL